MIYYILDRFTFHFLYFSLWLYKIVHLKRFQKLDPTVKGFNAVPIYSSASERDEWDKLKKEKLEKRKKRK